MDLKVKTLGNLSTTSPKTQCVHLILVELMSAGTTCHFIYQEFQTSELGTFNGIKEVGYEFLRSEFPIIWISTATQKEMGSHNISVDEKMGVSIRKRSY